MLHIDITQARPGMTIAMPVMHAQRLDSILVRAGYQMDETTIRRLTELGQRSLWVEAPGFEVIDHHLSPSVERARREMHVFAARALTDLHDDRAWRRLLREFTEACSSMAETFMAEPNAALFLEETESNEYRMIGHAANTAYLATIIGMKLQGYLVRQRKRLSAKHATNIVTLALGALLHDVGLSRLPEAVLARWEEQHDEFDTAWQKHSLLGHELVSGKVEPAAAAAVLHHHQYFDGSGFPQKANWEGRKSGLRGDAIHVFARIITVADQFDELRTLYSSRPRPLVEILAALTTGRMRRRFDPVILRALLEIAPAYTPGRQVTLSTGERAFVVVWRPSDPCRPKVAVIEDLRPLCRGETPEHRFIDLAMTPEVSIVQSAGQDVRDCQFSLPADVTPQGGHGLHYHALDAA
ncbi:MAG: HD domain-containing protein [Phycisphaerales bacterium]|nr:HD domain-containing protein [Phycisphaerales bacterium]